nr:protein of unknown function (DUF4142) [uncultured bacterium]
MDFHLRLAERMIMLTPPPVFGVAIAALAFSLATPAVAADNASTAPGERSTGKTQATPTKQLALNVHDQKFVQQAAQAGIAEVDAGKLASSQGSSDSIKKFANQMVQDHGKANDELKQIAQGKGAIVPDTADRAHRSLLDKLKKLSGPQFDRRYIADAGVRDHQEAVRLFRDEANKGADPDVKAFAQKTLPVIESHLQMARDIAKEVKSK